MWCVLAPCLLAAVLLLSMPRGEPDYADGRGLQPALHYDGSVL